MVKPKYGLLFYSNFYNIEKIYIVRYYKNEVRLRLDWSKDPGPPSAGTNHAFFISECHYDQIANEQHLVELVYEMVYNVGEN